jgi:hypothetical protein
VQYGLDTSRDGTLDPGEINLALTQYVCNGVNGAAGSAGAQGNPGENGYNQAVATAIEGAGLNCANGGVQLQFGLDTSRDGTLDPGEVNSALTRYICNGADGGGGGGGNGDYIANFNTTGTIQENAAIWIDGNVTAGSAAIGTLAAGTASLDTPALIDTDSSFLEVKTSDADKPLFMLRGDGILFSTGTYTGDADGDAKLDALGAGTRMMWYPPKGAFRAGGISGTQWDTALIGDYSVAIGQDVRASASNAMAFGLRSTAAQQSSFAAGEDNTASGAASVALGYHAHTNARQGSFVFSDRSSVDTLRAGVNHSANWRVSGGFRIFTASNLSTGVTIQSGASVSNWGQSNAVISTSTGAYLSTSGVWTNTSDANRKHHFEDISGDEVLEKLGRLPIQSWSYRAESEKVRHLGPTAQDFHAAFGLGDSTVGIGTVDADGVALAAAKALSQKASEQQAEIEALRRNNAELEARLKRIEGALLETRSKKPRGLR